MSKLSRRVELMLLVLLHIHRSTVTQDFRYSRIDFGGIIANTNHRVGPKLPCMSQHIVEGVASGPFAHRRIERNIAAKNALNARAEISNDRAGTHNDSPDDPKIFRHVITGQIKRGGGQRMCFSHTRY